MTDPESGSLLVTGPLGSGKTLTTARLLQTWVDKNGPERVFVLEFAPEFVADDGRVLGRRLVRFTRIPPGVTYLEVEALAPRAWGSDEQEAVELAAKNHEACAKRIAQVPLDCRALFVDDATIAYHVPGSDPGPLLDRIRGAHLAVVNALDPQEFDPDHPVTRQERRVLTVLADAADRVERLPARTLKEERSG